MIRIISGGQSGADRAALDFALELGFEYGGWCPQPGWAEDFPKPPGLLAHYPRLQETPDTDPRVRTDWNVRDSDATLVITPPGVVSPGTTFTIDCAQTRAKPLLVVDPYSPQATAVVIAWLKQHPDLRSLNIAGPRESEAPGTHDAVRALLAAVFL